MKRWSLVLATMLVLVMSTNVFAVEVEGDAYIGVYSKYLWRGYDLSDGEAVLQGGMDLSAYGFTVSYWSNYQISDGDSPELESGEITETDIIIDYTFDATEMLSVSVGNLHYYYNSTGSDDELYLGFAVDTLLAPEFYTYYAWDVEDDSGMDGLFFTLGVSHELEPCENVLVGLGALVGYNQENPLVGDYSNFHNAELTVSADYALNDNWSITGGLLYSDALTDDAEDEGVEDEVVGSLDVTFAF
ncbi:MAG: hypothetical protein OET90_00275 [Desulfuromonadales bacterium]|nr:hypothetical protein [Desulfuromonadales bacterium]